MELLTPSQANLERAANAIKAGKLVAMPTETVYGLGANAFDTAALAKVFEAKARPHFDPLIIHIADPATVDILAEVPDERTRLLMAAFWPGPLTLIMPKKKIVPDLATSGLPSVAIRFPAHPIARALISLSTGAVAAPSANPFGYLSPTLARHVAEQLGDRVDFIVDGGRCEFGVESTVLDVCGPIPRVLRPGALSLERLSAIVPDLELVDRTAASPESPGQLESHYSPHTPLRLVALGSLSTVQPRRKSVALFFSEESRGDAAKTVRRFSDTRCLSKSGDTLEAAANLFEILHEMDSTEFLMNLAISLSLVESFSVSAS